MPVHKGFLRSLPFFSALLKDRIVIDGKNGSGKSSLLKLLIGEPIEHSGTIKICPPEKSCISFSNCIRSKSSFRKTALNKLSFILFSFANSEKNIETAENLKLFPLLYYTNTLVSFSDVRVSYNGNIVCDPISFIIQQGDRIVIDGNRSPFCCFFQMFNILL